MKASNIVLLSAMIGASCCTFANTAEAYTAANTCSGNAIIWGSSFRMSRNDCSMPVGSNAYNSYNNAGWQWQQIHNLMDVNWFYNSCDITIANGRNETALVTRASINGKNGITQCLFGPCSFPFGQPTHYECDVKLANDMQYSNEDESFWNWSNVQQGQVVNIHEFGHVLGLGHQTGFDVMNANTPYPLGGGTGNDAQPFPDDANGFRALLWR